MLDQLIESNNHIKENKRRGGFLISTFLVVCSIFASGVLWSLFAKDLGIGAGNLEISALVAPLAVTEEQPLPKNPPPKQLKAAINADVRTKIVQNINETPSETPDKTSSEKSDVPPRNPNHLTVLGSDNSNAEHAAAYNQRGTVDQNTKGLGASGGTAADEVDSVVKATPPPPVRKEEVKKPAPNVSLGVVNGKAITLVKPPYPSAARAVHADGVVNVQVSIDEQGIVTSANAVSGHPLLRQAAEKAARASVFLPTTLSRQPVKVSGVIVYKFAAQ